MRLVPAAIVALAALVVNASAQEVRRAIPVDGASGAAPAPAAAPADPNSLAAFLAGKASRDFGPWQNTPGYAAFATRMAKLRDRYFTNYYNKMRVWSDGQLRPRLDMSRPVIYFFGGPDVLAANAYFPDAPVYILGGLEPIGSIVPPSSLTPADLGAALQGLEQSTETILSFGHFITKDMRAELDRTAFKGVLPLLAAFLSMADKRIDSLDYIGIRSDGTLEEMGAAFHGGKGTIPGLRLRFHGESGAEQTLYYVQANVADEALSNDGALLRWARGFGPGNVYLKAASYLLHESYFSHIRNFLLSNQAVLQDDSGIPLHFFLEKGWRVFLFGQYNGTLDIFKKYYQPDLVTAFQAGSTPLPFGTGYKWRQGESNLELALPPQAATRY